MNFFEPKSQLLNFLPILLLFIVSNISQNKALLYKKNVTGKSMNYLLDDFISFYGCIFIYQC
jgi:DNA polymerase sigma